MRAIFNRKNRIREIIADASGNSIPLVMMVALVVMIIGGAVAWSAVQVFKIARGEVHSQLTYFAAEAALERSMCNLDSVLTTNDFAKSRNILYTGEEDFIQAVIAALNNDPHGGIANRYDDIGIYGSGMMNGANAGLRFSWNGGFERIGLKRLKFPVTITAEASMENGIFRSYGKKAVATREFTVYISDRFELNGAAYTLGDLLAIGTGSAQAVTTVDGDVYVFGTGLDRAKRMEQYYNGGICAAGNAVLHIKNGSAYTRNLVRAGTFDEDEGSPACSIVVDHDIVAQGVQVFGWNDSIVALRDVYTFDDLEMNGANSCIAVKGNYYGLNPGDGKRHDTSSAVINTSPRYAGGLDNGYMKSRIVINGHVLINGATFRIIDTATGEAGHEMEGAALAWKGNQPVYIAEGIDPDRDNFDEYMEKLAGANGFSIILQHDWGAYDDFDSTGWTGWEGWRNEILSRAGYLTNNILNFPSKITGFTNYAMASNNRVYFTGIDESDTDIIKPSSLPCHIAEDIPGLDIDYFQKYIDMEWYDYTGTDGIRKGMADLMNTLVDHVEVFAGKEFNTDPNIDEITYAFTQGLNGKTEFMTLSDYLESNITGDPSSYILRYEAGDTAPTADVAADLSAAFPDPLNPHTDHHFLIMNFNPDKELRIKGTVNGIIFSLGKVVIEKDGVVNGAVIAAGRGYDADSGVEGSAAWTDDDGTPRLPRVVIHDDGTSNKDRFENWEYAALIFENGGIIHFPGRQTLLDAMSAKTGINFFEIF